ncbi:hypothetical protein [Gordonia rhizosphera]|uniref:Mce-associated membrane protein n=1 Tax=Gordonia rhizosphera NBRC 16068 TaxID=1108045 RepID=K6WHH4_9ACTN|nr:hypothetical protein [Gordonia rhizosphera]GAB91607.1 hypothetical protein GORHZ_138_00210 [Gordonia rhizosphera NBRC 16068]
MATDTETRTDDQLSVTEEATSTPAPKSTATRTSPLSSGSARGRRRWPKALAAVIALAVVGATAFFGYHYFADGGDGAVSPQLRSEAIDVSSDYAIKLSSFDYRNLDANREQIDAMSTPDFAKKYSEMVAALTEIVTNGKGEATATVSHAAVETISPDAATVLLFVDQKAKNVVAPDGKLQPYRMLVTLKRSGDNWLVDNVETL